MTRITEQRKRTPDARSYPTLVSDVSPPPIRWLDEVGMGDAGEVGGKAASLGEMRRALTSAGVRVPNGFVTTLAAYRSFLSETVPADTVSELSANERLLIGRANVAVSLAEALAGLFEAPADDDALDAHERAALARRLCLATPIPTEARSSIEAGYEQLCREYGGIVEVAVRSSGTREDSESASFAGQYESLLNVRGIEGVLDAWRRCAASAFTERALSYQATRGMDPREGGIAVVVMKMVRSDMASSGVAFTLDPDSGNRNVVVVTSSYGLGEPIVQGTVSPDTFVLWKDGVRAERPALVDRTLGSKEQKMVYASGDEVTQLVPVEPDLRKRWSLSPDEVNELSRMILLVEDHYGRPMDVEWAKDGISGELFLVQARPETIHAGGDRTHVREVFTLDAELAELEANGCLVATGHAVGSRIGSGKVRRYATYDEVIAKERRVHERIASGTDRSSLEPAERVFDEGDVLVTEMTTPDWEPLMRRASLIVTEKGGRTSHAAIVAREFGVPAIVGCGESVRQLEPLSEVTGSCAEGDTGYLLAGRQPFTVQRISAEDTAELRTKVKLNIGFPQKALHDAMLPSDGVGLARLEFILTSEVGIHPLFLAAYRELREFANTGTVADDLRPFEEELRAMDVGELVAWLDAVETRTPTYQDKRDFFVDRITCGVARICAAFHPRPVLVRLSDLKSNEYRDLVGGRIFEPREENPMIAWRGAARYVDDRFRNAFAMELEALRRVRHDMGLDNLEVMVPFCRTPDEGEDVAALLDAYDLSPRAGVPLFLMVELPSNVIESGAFIDAMKLAGGSIGTNDLVQTTYALSRDDLACYPRTIDARSPAVRSLVRNAIEAFRERGLEIGLCGQAPSDHPEEIPAFLVECGITSLSVTPDTLLQVRSAVKQAEESRS